MRRSTALGIAALLLLALASAVFAVRVARHYRARVEVGRVAITRLDERTKERLAGLRDKVFLTYYVTRREEMPSHLRRLERDVTRFLDALREESDGLVDYQIIDPETDPDLEGFAARRRVSPIRVRHVQHDAYSEQTIWSSLTISYGPYEPAEINGVTPEHLPRLQALLVEQLDQMERPRQPLVALAPKEGFYELHAALSERARVVRLDLDGGERIPEDVDALFWIDPTSAPPARLRELNLLVERGRSIVIAGSEHTVDVRAGGAPAGAGPEPTLAFPQTGFPAGALLGELGLRAGGALVCDGFNEAIRIGETTYEAPFVVRCIAPNQDFHNLENQPNGTLLFAAPAALEIDGERLAERAWSAQVLATTSDRTWLQPRPEGTIPLGAFSAEGGQAAAKRPLIVLTRPDDPWQGHVFVLAASTPFHDGMFEREGVAHWRLLRTLLDNVLSRERLVLARVGAQGPEPLPELEPGERLFWRALCVLLVPALLAALAAWRGALRSGARAKRRGTPWRARTAARTLALIALAVLATVAARAARARADLTDEGLNRLAPATRELAAQATGDAAVRAELVFSDRDRLPPDMRAQVGRVRDLLGDVRRAGAELEIVHVSPEDLDADERAALVASGIEPTRSVSRDEEVSTVRTIFASLRLSSGERTEVVDFPDRRAFDDLELRIAFALWRLQTGRRPRIALCPDLPRPSSAEAYEYYQTKGLFSPMGHDETSLARELLERAGFEVVFVNPRDPVLPMDIDVFVWLQPRRPVEGLLDQVTEYVYGGGSVLVAAQHFRMQSRQYRGTNFVFNYWPQPQSPDVETYWYPAWGALMVRNVLFDELKTRMVLESQISGRGSARDFEEMELALPFLIRASASNFDPQHPITRHLGDQAFLFGNYLELDEERLAELGIGHRVLMTTSARTWTYDWEGGWLPSELLEGPPDADGDGAPDYEGEKPLAALFEGQFPLPAEPLYVPPKPQVSGDDPAAEAALLAWERALVEEKRRRAELLPYPGRVLFVAGSELFKNPRLHHPDFRGDQFLLNSVAFLALPAGLAEVAARRPVARGFDFVPPDERLRWRGFVLGAFPALLVLAGFARFVVQRRARP